MEYPFRFKKVRSFQKEMMEDIYKVLNTGSNILINAPTGVGKTDASISATLKFAIKNGLSVLFLTPKISQHKIAIETLQGIKKLFYKDLKFVDIVGKQKLCTNPSVNNNEGEMFYSKCTELVKNGKCSYYKRSKGYSDEEKIPQELGDSAFLGHNKMFKESFDFGVCAYEISMHLAKTSNMIIADYSHILNPGVRVPFLKKISQTLNNCIIIWDEAHNIIEAASSYFNSSINDSVIESASKELDLLGSSIDLDYLKFSVDSIVKRSLKHKDSAFVDIKELSENIISDPEIPKILTEAGLEYLEKTKLRRSAIIRIAKFIELWSDEDKTLIRIISKKLGTPKLSINCVYPARALSVFNEIYSNIFMSATLMPLSMYSDMFGISDAFTRYYRSPFSSNNKLALIDDSVTTKYTNRSIEEYKRIAERIELVSERIPGNVAVFFPSFTILNNVKRYMRFKLYVQRREMSSIETEKLIESFKNDHLSIIFGVMGGSLSEGVDYSGNVIKGIIIVGIPLAPPDLELSAKINYLNDKFNGRGNEYSYTIPAIRRVIQAAGRAIRSETDRATIIFMDKRYKWRMYSSLINSSLWLTDSDNYLNVIEKFWNLDLPQVKLNKK